ncbi:Uncharacterized membrane protein YfhO [Lachnospiraceae bacterium]|nr:Uncharacterized membrane protein YfhO [Lachnospiraceae bacterium]
MSDNKKNAMKMDISKLISYLLVILIPLIIVLISLKAGGFEPFGEKDVITASKTPEEIKYYYEFYDKVHDHTDMSFSNSIDMVDDYVSHYLYHLSNPLNLLILLVPRDNITTVIDIIYLLNICLCSISLYVFLSYRKKSIEPALANDELSDFNNPSDDKSTTKTEKKNFIIGGSKMPKSPIGIIFYNTDYVAIALSIAFSLSSYFVSEGLNISFLPSIALLPLIMLGIDKLINHGSKTLYIVTLSLSIFLNIYISIISLLFIILYYCIEASSKNRIVSSLGKFVYSTIISILLCSVTTIPIITGNDFKNYFILNFVRPKQLTNPWNAFSQLMFKNDISYLTSFDCGINLYVGILGFFLCFCYIFNSRINLSTRIKYVLLVLFLTSGILFSTPNYLLNGLRGFTTNTYIYGYLLLIVILVMAYDNLIQIKGINKIGVTLSAVVLMALMLITMKKAEGLNSIHPLFYSMELLFVYFLIILIYRENSMNRFVFSILLSIICIGEMCITYKANLSNLGKVAYTRPTVDSISYKEYQTIRHIHEEYDSKATVLSLLSEEKDTEPFITALSGYDYIICSDSSSDIDLFDFIEEYKEDGMVRGVAVYKNKKPVKSSLYDNEILSYIYEPSYPFKSANIFSSVYADSGEVYKIIEGEAEAAPTLYSSYVSFSIKASELGNAYAKTYKIVHLGDGSKVKPVSSTQIIPIDRFEKYDYQYALFDTDVLNKTLDKITSKSKNSDVLPNQEALFEADADGYLAVPVKYSDNLIAKVNKQNVKINKFINNTIIIPVKKGTNTIYLQYSNKYMIIGIVISILALIIILTIAFLNLKKNSEKVDKETSKSKYNLKKYINIKNLQVYIITAMIMTILFIFMQMYTGCYPFGSKSTVRDDGMDHGYTIYIEKAKRIKSNTEWEFINYDMGIARDVTESLIYNIVHPLDLIKFKLLPESMYLFDFTLLYFLSYILNALSFIFYLTRRHDYPYKKDDKRLIALGLLYGLSSYSIVMFNYNCFRLMLYTPLIIWGMEKLIYENKKFAYILFLCFMMLYDLYPAFILCVFLCLIFITYRFDSMRHFLKSAGSFAISSIAAAGIAAIKILPYYSMTTLSGYSEKDSSASPKITDLYTSYVSLFNDYKPFKYMRAISYNNSQAAIYIGLIPLLLLILYVINKNISLKDRIKKIALLFIIYVSFNHSFLNYIFHGFHYQSLVPNRYASVFIFIILTVVADTLLFLHEYKSKELLIVTLSIITAFTVLHIFNNDVGDKGVICGIIILVISFIFILKDYLFARFKKKSKYKYEKIIHYILAIDIMLNAAFLLSYNIGDLSDFIKDACYIDNATQSFQGLTDKFTGTVYLNTENDNISCATDIESPDFFYSGASINTLNMYTRNNIFHSLNNSYYGSGNPLADMMMHTRYNIKNIYRQDSTTWYNKVKSVNNMDIYENPYFIPLGFSIDNKYIDQISEWGGGNKQYSNLFDYQNEFFRVFTDKDVYKIIKIKEFDPKVELDYSCYKLGEYKSGEEEIYINIHLDKNDIEDGSYFVCANNYMMYFDDIKKGDSLNFEVNIPINNPSELSSINDSIAIAILDKNALKEVHNILNSNTLDDINSDGRTITGNISITNEGRMYISLPYTDKWTVKVDGKKVESYNFLCGIGFDIANGNHDIRLDYTPTGLKEGAIITISTLIILLLLYFYTKYKKRINTN